MTATPLRPLAPRVTLGAEQVTAAVTEVRDPEAGSMCQRARVTRCS
jgi:hypothetical protein